MVQLLRKKPQSLNRKRINKEKGKLSVPPIGAPNWCLSEAALTKFGRETNNIPSYDYDSDEKVQDEDIQNHEDENISEHGSKGGSSHKRKRKNKSHKKGLKQKKKEKKNNNSKKRRK
jgi:hypothetical protein